ncbi:MAG: hypothetical protein AAF411_17610 [Myxococcota bacterium]
MGFQFDSLVDNAVITIDVPLRVEHWFSDRFSFQPQVGVVMIIDPNDSFSFGVGDTGLFAGANFVFYLNEVGGSRGAPAPAPQAAQELPVTF